MLTSHTHGPMSQYHPLNPAICTLGSPERVGKREKIDVTINDIKELRLTYLCTEISGKKIDHQVSGKLATPMLCMRMYTQDTWIGTYWITQK